MKKRYLFLVLVAHLCSSLSFYAFKQREHLAKLLSPNHMDYYQPVLVGLLWGCTLFGFTLTIWLAYKAGLFLDWKATFKPKRLLFLIAITLGLFVTNLLVSKGLAYFSWNSNANQDAIGYWYRVFPRALLILSGTFGAALYEEIIYRACAFKVIDKDRIALLFSVVLFALIHAQDVTLIAYLPTGLVLGWLYYKQKRLPDCILVHTLHNILFFLC